MIEQITLQNFKSIRSQTIQLGRLNVVIGPNGSGKSNFLAVFQLMKAGASGNLQSHIRKNGGIKLLHHFDAGDEPMRWEISLSDTADQDRLFYSAELLPVGFGNDYDIIREEVERPPYENHDTRYKFLSASNGRIHILKALYDDNSGQLDEDINPKELAITQKRDRARYPAIWGISDMLASIEIYRGFGSDALENIRTPQFLNTAEPLRLDPSGNNLVPLIQQLANTPAYEVVYDRLIEVLRAVFPDFSKLDTPITAGGMGSLNYRSQDFRVPIPAIAMSDGQLRFIALAVLLLLPYPPPLIAIDEPEIGLHPEMLAVLAELLQDAAGRTQIIITTHSTRLLDAVDAADIITVNRSNGISEFARLDQEKLGLWLDRYSIGKLWTMGKLHA